MEQTVYLCDEEQVIDICPNCGAIWGINEIDMQECDCCGYPDCDEDDCYL